MDSHNYIAKSVPTFLESTKTLEALHRSRFICESKAFTHIEVLCVKKGNAVHTWYV